MVEDCLLVEGIADNDQNDRLLTVNFFLLVHVFFVYFFISWDYIIADSIKCKKYLGFQFVTYSNLLWRSIPKCTLSKCYCTLNSKGNRLKLQVKDP